MQKITHYHYKELSDEKIIEGSAKEIDIKICLKKKGQKEEAKEYRKNQYHKTTAYKIMELHYTSYCLYKDNKVDGSHSKKYFANSLLMLVLLDGIPRFPTKGKWRSL